MKRRHFAGCILLLALGVSLTPAQNRKANLSRLVVVGDSLSAGFQNFSLLGTQQIHNYASLVAGQANTPLVLPLVRFPGVPNVFQLTSLSPLISLCLNRPDFRVTGRRSMHVRGDSPDPADCQSSYTMSRNAGYDLV